MAETFPALVSDLLRADPGRPLVTFYDDETGERTELSVATWANWVAKTSSLLVEELDLSRGETIHLDLPTHWLGPVFLGAAWTVGLVVVPEPDGADAVVSGPERLVEHAARGVEVIGCALLPLGVRFRDEIPAGVRDFGIEVWSQPDSFLPYDPPSADDEALPGVTHRELLAAPTASEGILGDGGRLLTTANPASPSGLASFTEPLVRGGSAVWVRHADPGTWDGRYEAERATAAWLT
ncbi:TIGR03089 family protein [Nocardioides alcanivorans]|uniref:TIGR03089 family protein n=1 Tax=Nocardioides alcanivorans TaxID=2897352 RepID=UPI001F2E498A|nr:TIGR03089 family protein [Nocardioides alcanivorans]